MQCCSMVLWPQQRSALKYQSSSRSRRERWTDSPTQFCFCTFRHENTALRPQNCPFPSLNAVTIHVFIDLPQRFDLGESFSRRFRVGQPRPQEFERFVHVLHPRPLAVTRRSFILFCGEEGGGIILKLFLFFFSLKARRVRSFGREFPIPIWETGHGPRIGSRVPA